MFSQVIYQLRLPGDCNFFTFECSVNVTMKKNASRRQVNKNSLTWWCVLKTSWRSLCKTSWRCLEDVFQDVLKTSWQDVSKMSWRRLEDVLKTYGQNEYIGLDQEVLKPSWRRKAKANIFVLIKTSSEDEDERRFQGVLKTSWSRRMFAGRVSNHYARNVYVKVLL